jgi:DNA mismatch endonuclease, patch repair protein
MADRLSPAARSANMRAIRGRDTSPELAIRRLAHRLGYRFTVQGKGLPGRPDLVFSKRRKVVFVHGCFWHHHEDCRFAYIPKTRTTWWTDKFAATRARDLNAVKALSAEGWDALVVWECECSDLRSVGESLKRFLGRRRWP